MTSIELQLRDLRDLLKSKIENKFNVTCTSTTILGLIGELQELIRIEINNIDDVLPPELSNHSLADKILILSNYLVEVLDCAGISADITEGFTTLVNKINDIELLSPMTPTISISRNKNSLSSGSSVTLTATVTGDVDHGMPSGSVKFYEGTSSTAFKTVTSPSTTASSTAKFQTTRSKTVSKDTTYKFSAKFISNDNTKYNDSVQSSKVSVKWTVPTGKTPSSLSATASFQGTGLVWSYSGAVGTVKVGTSNGGSEIGTYNTSSGSGSIQMPGVSSFTLYVSDTGNDSYEAGSVSVTATR